jgi:pyrroloquinoline quinone biosynthesis protein B
MIARRCVQTVALLALSMLLTSCVAPDREDGGAGGSSPASAEPFLIVLGIAQDGGVPQAGSFRAPGWSDPARRRRVSCLGIVDPSTGERWMIDATPDFREQLTMLHSVAPAGEASLPLSGIILTHAHMGHYTGLMFLGHESMGAKNVPVYAMPRMAAFLESSGPWSQLVRLKNIELRPLEPGAPVKLNARLTITPIPVPHRQEYSEVVGFRIDGPQRSALFIPDIDSWDLLDAQGVRIEELIAGVDVAYLDGTFYANGEIPGRDMTGFPHPFITTSMERFASLPDSERAKVRFIHLNHTNPALWADTEARRAIEQAGFAIAEEGERFDLAGAIGLTGPR